MFIPFNLISLEDINRAIAGAPHLGAEAHIPIWRAVRDEGLAVAMSLREARGRFSHRPGLPLLVYIGDDDYASTGPSRWQRKLLRDFLQPARHVVVHGTGAQVWHYEAIVRAALSTGWAVIIETDTAHVREWAEFVRRHTPNRCKRVVIVPPPGSPAHPIAPAVLQ